MLTATKGYLRVRTGTNRYERVLMGYKQGAGVQGRCYRRVEDVDRERARVLLHDRAERLQSLTRPRLWPACACERTRTCV